MVVAIGLAVGETLALVLAVVIIVYGWRKFTEGRAEERAGQLPALPAPPSAPEVKLRSVPHGEPPPGQKPQPPPVARVAEPPREKVRTAEDRENSCWKARYGKCDAVERSADIVFVYPRGQFTRAAEAVRRLQAGWDLLRNATGADPKLTFGQRVVIGYRHPSDEGGKDCLPGWGKEGGDAHGFSGEEWPFVNVPWGFLGRGDQPEECCTHTMVYAFTEARPLRDNRKEWVEGVCDFLRVPVFDAVGMPAVAAQRYLLYRSSAWKPGASSYHDHAGRLIRWCEQRGLDVRKKDQLPQIVPKLWQMDFAAELDRPPG